MKNLWLPCIALLFLLLVEPVNAQTVGSQNYQVQINQIANPASVDILTPTPSPLASSNTTPEATQKPADDSQTLSLSISSSQIDYGVLSATNPVTRTNTLTVEAKGILGYTVYGFENAQLTATNGSIPDATCDSGTCSLDVPASWTNPLTYGFGYRCDPLSGTDCSPDFSDPNKLHATIVGNLQTKSNISMLYYG